MAARHELKMKITSATAMKKVNWRLGDVLNPYAVVWVEPGTKISTYAASDGTSHGWHQQLVIPISAPVEDSTLHIDIFHEAADGANLLIGSAEIGLIDLFAAADGVVSGKRAIRSLQLLRPSGRPEGSLVIAASIRMLAWDFEPMEVDDDVFP